MSPTEEKSLDLTELPQILQVFIENQKPVVIVMVHEFFGALYPDGQTNGDPGVWGIIMTDVVRHIAKAHHEALTRLANEGLGPEPPSEKAVLNRLMQIFIDEMEIVRDQEVKSETILVPRDPKGKN